MKIRLCLPEYHGHNAPNLGPKVPETAPSPARTPMIYRDEK